MDMYDHFQSNILEALRNLGGVLDHDPACTLSLYEASANGILAAALDTYNNSLLQAKRQEKRLTRILRDARQFPDAADMLPTFADSRESRISCYNTSFSNMKHILYSNYYDELVENKTPTGEVLEGLLTILDGVITHDLFKLLNISSPFRVGICSYDSVDMWVVKILNWPAHTGSRV